MGFVEELRWRGILSNSYTPEIEEYLSSNKATGYIGFDPTAESLHIGSLVPIIILKHFQNYGHKPIALVGGATGMIGDPSGKTAERNLLNEETLQRNLDGIAHQLSKFLDFETQNDTKAEIVNNYDWMKNFTFIDFARDIGKHISANYMMSKESVKKRFGKDNDGMSFTEFTYQLLQGYDFLHLYKEKNCLVQMGGSDQWGNITTGIEMIRRIESGKAHALTCNLITKSDGSKFGKSEGGNVWLDPKRTSPYKFYQFWLNIEDEEAQRYIKIFTFLPKEEIEVLTANHLESPHQRILQKAIAEALTEMVHSKQDLENVIQASNILFGKATSEDLVKMDERLFLEVFEGVPMSEIDRQELSNSILILDLIMYCNTLFKSKGEARRALKENSVYLNKSKITAETHSVGVADLISDKYLLVQKGKKNFEIIRVK